MDNKMLIYGYSFVSAGGAISWMSKLQFVIALSIIESEYIEVTKVFEEGGLTLKKIHISMNSINMLIKVVPIEKFKLLNTENAGRRHGLDKAHDKVSGSKEIRVIPAVEVAQVKNVVLCQSGREELHNVPAFPEIDIEVSSKVKQVATENVVQPMEDPTFAVLRKKLVRLARDEPEFIAVQNTFLIGFSDLITQINLVGIYRHSTMGSVAITRLKSFDKQIEITKRYRGYANVCGGWHGSSREGVIGIILYGFWNCGEPVGGSSYGNGIYLSPDEHAHISACYSELDNNGIQHMVFCRAIMGNMEQVRHGTNQYHPSSENFDSGVDDLQDPKHYVVWPTHMNTHIHPEYVVSFTLPPSVREHLAGKRDGQGTVDVVMRSGQQVILALHPETNGQNTASEPKWPTSGWLPFTMLFHAIEHRLSPFVKDMLLYNCNLYKSKRITRKEMIQKMRMLVGDNLLLSTLKRLQLKVFDEGGVTLKKIHISMNPINMLIKVVPIEKFKLCMTSMGLAKT
ncbi:probable inactive poly [ADP-ribose] polymerase SRO3 [Magnolia sinica]|uniref:probable inactive poly [ADP-ribose] polymerase SRO3 n=1 Tax=Magnolia sinica TaxID=86752 RepID=UPI0026598F1D|nr:probable inactive poly [ADP-ribose] polymerase SRO3 [Magnolia sinica]